MSGMNIRGAQSSKHLSTRRWWEGNGASSPFRFTPTASLEAWCMHFLLICLGTACCFQPRGKDIYISFGSYGIAAMQYTFHRPSYPFTDYCKACYTCWSNCLLSRDASHLYLKECRCPPPLRLLCNILI